MDKKIELMTYVKSLSLDRFLKEDYGDENLYNLLQKSKSGEISISKVGSPSTGDSGYTAAFGEGLSCYLSNNDTWYQTSVIQKIRWNDGEFDTLNSTYKFTFKEDDNNKS